MYTVYNYVFVFVRQLESLGGKEFVFPHLTTCTGTYCDMEVTVATLEYKKTKNMSAIMHELTGLRLGQDFVLHCMIIVPHISVTYAVVTWYSYWQQLLTMSIT